MADMDCRECGKRKRKYQDCIGKEWYSWGDIRFCPHQVIWLFARFGHRLLDIDGKRSIGVAPWFNIPMSPGDIDLPLHRAPLKPDAYFVDEVDVLAELEVRLECLGRRARRVLVAEIGAGLLDGKASNIIIREFTQEAQEALHYITGVRRKRTAYHQWKSSRLYYKNITKPTFIGNKSTSLWQKSEIRS